MTIHKCDVCRRELGYFGKRLTVYVDHKNYEFCDKHAAPFLRALKDYKLSQVPKQSPA
jgi:hypothetical protein